MPLNGRTKPEKTSLPAQHTAAVRHNACTCGSLRKASRRISQFYDAALAPVGIKSTQYSILSEVGRGRPEGPVTIRELATAMVMDRSTLGHNLKPLERRGLVEIVIDEHDRRGRRLKLTRAGRARLAKALPVWDGEQAQTGKRIGKSGPGRVRADLRALS